MASSKRLEMLLTLASVPDADTFTRYALAMELRGLGRTDEAYETFRTLREKDPDYVPTYQMCAMMLVDAGRRVEAKEWLTRGVEAAQKSGNTKAVSEMDQVLKDL